MKRNPRTELKTLEKMLTIYCRAKHGNSETCPRCRKLLDHAAGCLVRCQYNPKPSCKNCPLHCWSPEIRARIKAVMRYAGPRMPLRHPLLTLRHWLGI